MTGYKTEIIIKIESNLMSYRKIEKGGNDLILTDDLLGYMAKRHITQKELAARMGMTPKTFGLKMKKGVFGSDEIEIMIKELEIENPSAIFFAQ